MLDLFTFRAAGIPAAARVAGFHGSEALSRPYGFDVFLVLTEGLGLDVDMAGAVGGRATLVLESTAGQPPFGWSGILASLTLVNEVEKRSVFRATMVPALWRLGSTMHSRVFTQMSIPDVLRAVLGENGVTASFDLSGSYATEEHVCQYRESDLDFVSRWMEREGMYYYFEQGEAEEQLVVTDDKASAIALLNKPVRFYAQSAHDVSVGGSLRSLTSEHSALPASVRMRDYDYARPALEVSGTAPVAPAGRGQISSYGERFFTPGDGERLARVRAQSIGARQVLFRAIGSATHLRPGYSFEVEDHPRPAFNAEYLAVSVEHDLNQAAGTPEIEDLLGSLATEVYRATVVAVPATVQFRAEQRTPWPRIYGFENATVDGPAASEYAQIDDQGRYDVKLHFDESALENGKASTKVRMLQPHGGNPEGFHFPLRKGTEVLCTFLGGDPDRPVIAGVVPNAITPSAVTASNHMTNVIQTGGKNRLEMEDPEGSQRVRLSTPTENTFLAMGAPVDGRHFTLSTDAHGYVNTGMNLGVEVKQEMTTHVVNDNVELYDDNHLSTVKGDRKQSVDGDRTIAVKGDQGVSISGDHTFDLKGDETVTIKGNQQHTVTGDHGSSFLAKRSVEVGGDHSLAVTGTGTHSYGNDFSVKYATNAKETVGGDSSSTVEGDSGSDVKGSSTETIKGNKTEYVWGSENTVVGGAKDELTLGLSTDTTIGLSTDVKIGAVLEIVLAAKLAITIGASLELEGIHLKDSAAEMETTITEIKDAAVSLQSRVANLEDAGMWLANHAVSIVV